MRITNVTSDAVRLCGYKGCHKHLRADNNSGFCGQHGYWRNHELPANKQAKKAAVNGNSNGLAASAPIHVGTIHAGIIDIHVDILWQLLSPEEKNALIMRHIEAKTK